MFGFESTAEEVTAGLDLSGRTYLVTGCNSGLGQETTRVLAMRGAHVVGAARTLAKAQAGLAGLDGTPVACELSDLASVRSAVAAVAATGRTLDGIIANAGIMALPELRQQDGVELQLFTNHVGHFVLVTGLLDRLAPGGRVVILSSGAHFMASGGLELDNVSGERDYHPWRMYGRSKLANVQFARSLARRFAAEGRGCTANAVHPGVIRTNLARHVADVEGMFARIQQSMRLKSVPQGAATQVLVATHPDLAGTSGAYFADCAPADTLPAAQDDEAGDALWAWTASVVA